MGCPRGSQLQGGHTIEVTVCEGSLDSNTIGDFIYSAAFFPLPNWEITQATVSKIQWVVVRCHLSRSP